MENMTKELVSFNSLTPIGVSTVNGMTVYKALKFKEDGFMYQIGTREIEGGLKVVEALAEGVGCCFLCGISVFDAENELVCDIPVGKDVKYCRQIVVEMVVKHLTDKVLESLEGNVNIDDVRAKVMAVVDRSYFEKSRQIALDWARKMNIL